MPIEETVTKPTKCSKSELASSALEGEARKLYLHNILKNLAFWLPIFTVYFIAKGLNYSQIMSLLAIQSISQIICEMPAGVIADVTLRKHSLLLSSIFKTTFVLLLLVGRDFSAFAIAYAFFGAALAFESGADTAYLYDLLKFHSREEEYTKFEGKAYSSTLIGLGLGALFGGGLAGISYSIPVALSAVACALSAVVAVLLKEPREHERAARNPFSVLAGSVKTAVQYPKVCGMIFFYAFCMSVMVSLQRFYQPLLQRAGVAVTDFGYFYFVWLLASAVTSRFAFRLHGRLPAVVSLMIAPVLLMIAYLIIGASGSNSASIGSIILTQFAYGYLRPAVSTVINERIASAQRATVLSLIGLFQSVTCAAVACIIGNVADHISVATLFLYSAVALAAVSSLLVLFARNSQGNSVR